MIQAKRRRDYEFMTIMLSNVGGQPQTSKVRKEKKRFFYIIRNHQDYHDPVR